MGYTSYDSNLRSVRAQASGFHTKSIDQIFTQSESKKVHESMSPVNLRVRECRDSDAHPNTIAIILGLDETGSMGRIPHMLIKDGLPHIMGTIVEKGSPDVALCFVGVGDHKADRAPLQVGQFESGDEELDQWLTRTWLEGNGGGNGGESYPLVWYFAAKHTDIDCYNKRGQKGILFTVGDEPFHNHYSADDLRKVMGDTARVEGTVTAAELLHQAQEKYHVYHLAIQNGYDHSGWKELMGKQYIPVHDHNDIPKIVAEIVLEHSKAYASGVKETYLKREENKPGSSAGSSEDTEIL
jgi:hypothetical protein